MKKLRVAATTAVFCLLAGCSDSPPPATAVKKTVAPPEPIKGRSALYQMYGAARSWAANAQVLELHSIHLPEVKSERGKAAAWQATFVSQQAGRSRPYTYSVIEAEGNLHKGVFAGLDEGWSGARGNQKPFLIAAVKTDSDEVLETALKKAADYEKKFPTRKFLPAGTNQPFPGSGGASYGALALAPAIFPSSSTHHRRLSADDAVAAVLEKLLTEQANPASEESTRCDRRSCVSSKMKTAPWRMRWCAARVIGRWRMPSCRRDERAGALLYRRGTSGRLGVLDASECPPTFGASPELVQGIIAGGEVALAHSTEASEDDATMGAHDLKQRAFTAGDVLVGIAASGRTPYVLGAIAEANRLGAVTAGISCTPGSELACAVKIAITPLTGPEVMTGSTRMKAGTATKMILNMLTTASFIRLGYVYGNLMVNVQPKNAKLLDRARRIVAHAGKGFAGTRGRAAGGRRQRRALAIVMAERNSTAPRAREAGLRQVVVFPCALGEKLGDKHG
jgi:N-acetylmuramic acid 6-phosphate etherase